MKKSAPVPLDREAVRRIVERQPFDLGRASIRQMNNLVNAIERELGLEFIRMEFGIPGFPVDPIAIAAEAEALGTRGVGQFYAPFEGIPELKEEAARFVKLFLDVDVPPSCCVPTVGAMQGCFAALALAGHMRRGRKRVISLEPGFPVNKTQMRLLGLERDGVDFYDHRGARLLEEVERRAASGDACAILWSSPNNPSWIVLTDEELAGLGRICDGHDLLAIEDLAYFGMDVREDYTRPGEPPFQPTVLRHTRNAVSVISSSKIFSYAGQRIALCVISPELMQREAPDLHERLGTKNVGQALIHGVLYPITASVPESPQYGLLALLRAVNAGNSALFRPAQEYARRAGIAKRLFLANGFRLVYDNDLGRPLADGFYFTIAHPAYARGADLQRELLHYGISAITLETTGSCRTEGLRACVSLIDDRHFESLELRLARFREDHPAR